MNEVVSTQMYACGNTNLESLKEHPFTSDKHLVLLIEEGSAKVLIDDDQVLATKNTMIFIRPQTELRLLERSNDFRSFYAVFLLSLVHEATQRIEPAFFAIVFQKKIWPVVPEIRACVEAFKTMFRYSCSDFDNPFRHDMIVSLISIFIRGFYGLLQKQYPSLQSSQSIRTNALFRKFLHLLEEYYMIEHSVQFYAEQMYISSKYLTQITRKVTQKTPKALIDFRLISESIRLLEKTDLSIQEISNKLGFPDQSYFGRFFRRYLHVSPAIYRVNPGKVRIPQFVEFKNKALSEKI